MQQARREYGDWLLNIVIGINPHELILVDFNLWISRTQGKAARGQRALRIVRPQSHADFGSF